MNRIELGQEVQCKVTGFKGIAISRVEFINGCIQYCVKPKIGKENKMPEGEYIDQQQLEVVGEGIRIEETPKKGGPQADLPMG